ncbi:MAG TPA: hypothetical protein VJ910_01105 [Desulfuromonadales bacterium]|nr:hypothetical protein [Desulfuromonadales bacterium]
MFLADLIIVLLIVAMLTAIFGAGYRRHRGSSLFAFFILLLTLTWAVGIWVVPFGYPVYGVYWLPFLTAGVLFAVLLVALIPPSGVAVARARETAPEPGFFGVFFWILMLILMLVIITGYLY